MLVEIDHKYLIFRVAGTRKCQGSVNHVRVFGAHASAVVNHQANRDGNIFMAERFDLLENFIFIDLEVFLVSPEIGAPLWSLTVARKTTRFTFDRIA